MANNTDLSNLPETLTIDTKVYSDLYYIMLNAEGLLGALEAAGIEIPDPINRLYAENIRETIPNVR